MFTKEMFIEVMVALENQHLVDLGYSKLLSEYTGAPDVPVYDNSILTKMLFSLLQKQFPPIDGDCEIERYCYELNFGNVDGIKVLTYEDLWYALIGRVTLELPLSENQKDVQSIASNFGFDGAAKYTQAIADKISDLSTKTANFINEETPEGFIYFLEFSSKVSSQLKIKDRLIITPIHSVGKLIVEIIIKNQFYTTKENVIEVKIVETKDQPIVFTSGIVLVERYKEQNLNAEEEKK